MYYINKFNLIISQSKIYNNLYNCGCHNGKSKYYYTSIESAVSNALALANVLEAVNKPLKETAQLATYINWLIIAFVLILIGRYYYKNL